MTGQSSEIWLSTTEASDLLGVHPDTLRRWAKKGDVPHIRRGCNYGFRRSDIVGRAQVLPATIQLRANASDLAVAMRVWKNPPPDAWKIIEKALWIAVLAGVKNSGVPVDYGRDAVELVYHAVEGRVESEQTLRMLEEMEHGEL